jgi:hypothetical protein
MDFEVYFVEKGKGRVTNTRQVGADIIGCFSRVSHV